jgi:ATP-binding cassette subfamily C protein CydD
MLNRRLLSWARSQRVLFALTIALASASALTILAQAWLLSVVIDRVLSGGEKLDALVPLLALLLAVVAARAVLHGAQEWSASALAIRLKQNLRQMVLARVLARGPAYARGARTGELSTTAVEGIEALDAYFSQYLPQLVIAVLVPLTIFLVIVPLDFVSALILLITAPLIPFFMRLIGNAAEGLTQRQFKRLGALSAHFLDVLQGLTTAKLLNASQALAASVRHASEEYAQATFAVLRVAFLSAFVLELLATISVALVAVGIGLRVLYFQMNFQPALFILILAPEFYIPLRMLGQRYHAAASGAAAAQRLAEILDAPLPITQSLHRPIPQFPNRIVFQHIAFSYTDARAALRDISFEIRAGKTVALFGPSGAGKTTIVNLLLRFDEPTRGEILLDDAPLRAFDADAWRAHIAYVPQAPHLFHDTIANNLRLARPNASDADLQRAARAAKLHDWIMTLPQDYETVIGEEGARLSGGQAQRLALARAFLKDAPLLILDEPTSSVDPELEAQLREATERLMRGRTTLLIAHRLATLYRADEIVVIENGRVVERGKHDALLARDGTYRQLALAGAGDG